MFHRVQRVYRPLYLRGHTQEQAPLAQFPHCLDRPNTTSAVGTCRRAQSQARLPLSNATMFARASAKLFGSSSSAGHSSHKLTVDHDDEGLLDEVQELVQPDTLAAFTGSSELPTGSPAEVRALFRRYLLAEHRVGAPNSSVIAPLATRLPLPQPPSAAAMGCTRSQSRRSIGVPALAELAAPRAHLPRRCRLNTALLRSVTALPCFARPDTLCPMCSWTSWWAVRSSSAA